MTNPADTALQKIVASYGRRAPMLTRTQAFAKAARLYNDIDEKRLYAQVPEDDRKMMMALVQRYALLLRSEETIEHSPAYYPLALSRAAFRGARQIEGTAVNIVHSIHDTIAFASTLAGYTDIFNDATREIEQNPDNYPSRSVSEFMEDVTHLRVDRGPFKMLFSRATRFLKDEFAYVFEKLNGYSYVHDHAAQTQAIKDYYIPAEGPDTAEELLFMTAILYDHASSIFAPRTEAFADMKHSLDALFKDVRGLCGDIPDQNLAQFWDTRKYRMSSPLLRGALITPGAAPQIAVAMTRHYLERHRDKIAPDKAIALHDKLADLYIRTFAYHQDNLGTLGLTISDDDKQTSINKMLYESWEEWPRPSSDDLIQFYDSKLKGKNKLRFHELLERTEPYYDLQVSYYAEQSEFVRKLRRNLFRQDSRGGEQEAYRAAFIKHVADNHPDALTHAGFSPMAISFMGRTGKMLPDTEAEPAYNVDHIVDLYCGGTNHRDNLCLVPAGLNKAKNDLLLLQTGLHDKEETAQGGAWIITLRPKTLRNGQPSPVLLERPQGARTEPLSVKLLERLGPN